MHLCTHNLTHLDLDTALNNGKPCKDAIYSNISIDELLLILFSRCPASVSEHWVWAYPNGVQVRELCGESVQVIGWGWGPYNRYGTAVQGPYNMFRGSL